MIVIIVIVGDAGDATMILVISVMVTFPALWQSCRPHFSRRSFCRETSRQFSIPNSSRALSIPQQYCCEAAAGKLPAILGCAIRLLVVSPEASAQPALPALWQSCPHFSRHPNKSLLLMMAWIGDHAQVPAVAVYPVTKRNATRFLAVHTQGPKQK